MTPSLGSFSAIYVAYAVPCGLLYWVTRWAPATWPAPPRGLVDRPKLDLLAAIGALVVIILLNLAYNAGNLLQPARFGALSKAAFLADLAVIWSPLALVLLWRRQGLASCLVSPRGMARKTAWAAALSIVGVALFVAVDRLVGAGAAAPPRALLGKLDAIQALQSLLQFSFMGFLLVRLVGIAGRAAAVAFCSAAYGLVKYPYYLGAGGMTWFVATEVIAFDILVAVVVLHVVLDRGDVLVVAMLHFFLDWIQRT